MMINTFTEQRQESPSIWNANADTPSSYTHKSYYTVFSIVSERSLLQLSSNIDRGARNPVFGHGTSIKKEIEKRKAEKEKN